MKRKKIVECNFSLFILRLKNKGLSLNVFVKYVLPFYCFFNISAADAQLIVSGYLPNTKGKDGNYEYIELFATENIDFSVTPYTIVTCNNGNAMRPNGWITGTTCTYAMEISNGKINRGETVYIGGINHLLNGAGTEPLDTLNWVVSKDCLTEPGDGGIGSKRVANFGILGNGGDADGIAIFNCKAKEITDTTLPFDVLFYGDSITASATYGYLMPDGSTFCKNSNIYPIKNKDSYFYKIKGTYNHLTKQWVGERDVVPVLLNTKDDIFPLINIVPEIFDIKSEINCKYDFSWESLSYIDSFIAFISEEKDSVILPENNKNYDENISFIKNSHYKCIYKGNEKRFTIDTVFNEKQSLIIFPLNNLNYNTNLFDINYQRIIVEANKSTLPTIITDTTIPISKNINLSVSDFIIDKGSYDNFHLSDSSFNCPKPGVKKIIVEYSSPCQNNKTEEIRIDFKMPVVKFTKTPNDTTIEIECTNDSVLYTPIQPETNDTCGYYQIVPKEEYKLKYKLGTNVFTYYLQTKDNKLIDSTSYKLYVTQKKRNVSISNHNDTTIFIKYNECEANFKFVLPEITNGKATLLSDETAILENQQSKNFCFSVSDICGIIIDTFCSKVTAVDTNKTVFLSQPKDINISLSDCETDTAIIIPEPDFYNPCGKSVIFSKGIKNNYSVGKHKVYFYLSENNIIKDSCSVNISVSKEKKKTEIPIVKDTTIFIKYNECAASFKFVLPEITNGKATLLSDETAILENQQSKNFCFSVSDICGNIIDTFCSKVTAVDTNKTVFLSQPKDINVSLSDCKTDTTIIIPEPDFYNPCGKAIIFSKGMRKTYSVGKHTVNFYLSESNIIIDSCSVNISVSKEKKKTEIPVVNDTTIFIKYNECAASFKFVLPEITNGKATLLSDETAILENQQSKNFCFSVSDICGNIIDTFCSKVTAVDTNKTVFLSQPKDINVSLSDCKTDTTIIIPEPDFYNPCGRATIFSKGIKNNYSVGKHKIHFYLSENNIIKDSCSVNISVSKEKKKTEIPVVKDTIIFIKHNECEASFKFTLPEITNGKATLLSDETAILENQQSKNFCFSISDFCKNIIDTFCSKVTAVDTNKTVFLSRPKDINVSLSDCKTDNTIIIPEPDFYNPCGRATIFSKGMKKNYSEGKHKVYFYLSENNIIKDSCSVNISVSKEKKKTEIPVVNDTTIFIKYNECVANFKFTLPEITNGKATLLSDETAILEIQQSKNFCFSVSDICGNIIDTFCSKVTAVDTNKTVFLSQPKDINVSLSDCETDTAIIIPDPDFYNPCGKAIIFSKGMKKNYSEGKHKIHFYLSENNVIKDSCSVNISVSKEKKKTEIPIVNDTTIFIKHNECAASFKFTLPEITNGKATLLTDETAILENQQSKNFCFSVSDICGNIIDTFCSKVTAVDTNTYKVCFEDIKISMPADKTDTLIDITNDFLEKLCPDFRVEHYDVFGIHVLSEGINKFEYDIYRNKEFIDRCSFKIIISHDKQTDTTQNIPHKTPTQNIVEKDKKHNYGRIIQDTIPDFTEKVQKNILTPNGDGINDYFEILDIQDYPDNEIVVMNKWGRIVFSQKNYQNNWDGKNQSNSLSKGELLPMSTYYYVFFVNGKLKKAGFVELIY